MNGPAIALATHRVCGEAAGSASRLLAAVLVLCIGIELVSAKSSATRSWRGARLLRRRAARPAFVFARVGDLSRNSGGEIGPYDGFLPQIARSRIWRDSGLSALELRDLSSRQLGSRGME